MEKHIRVSKDWQEAIRNELINISEILDIANKISMISYIPRKEWINGIIKDIKNEANNEWN